MSLEDAHQLVRDFNEERNWGDFHTPKDLSIGLVTESSELLDIFRFKSVDEQESFFEDEAKREEIEDEIADIFFFLLRFSDLNNIDLEDVLENKLEKNEKKYPKDEYKGTNKEYDE